MHSARLPSVLLLVAGLMAQAPAVPIHEDSDRLGSSGEERRILEAAAQLRAGGKLLDFAAVRAQLPRTVWAAPSALPKPATEPLAGPQLWQRARSAYARVGFFFQCRSCEKWHLSLSGGYAIAADGIVATCQHVVVPDDEEMREGFLICADDQGNVFPVLEILASDAANDVAILRTGAAALVPLPLRTAVLPGEAAFVYSDPMATRGYFSAGIVNRFAYEPIEGSDARRIIMNVSTDWAPGSSGAGVLDAFGNAIGHVATITTHGEEGGGDDVASEAGPKGWGRETYMVLHAATRAADVLALLQPVALKTPEDKAAGVAPKAPK